MPTPGAAGRSRPPVECAWLPRTRYREYETVERFARPRCFPAMAVATRHLRRINITIHLSDMPPSRIALGVELQPKGCVPQQLPQFVECRESRGTEPWMLTENRTELLLFRTLSIN